MPENVPLIVAMAEACSDTIVAWDHAGHGQPASLRSDHLLWMCEEIVAHAGDWPATRIHRWIGFVQGAMIANRMIDLDQAKAMFQKAKHAHRRPDADLLDHLDPDKYFRFDLGGQG